MVQFLEQEPKEHQRHGPTVPLYTVVSVCLCVIAQDCQGKLD